MTSWSREQCLALLDEYEKRPVLWNPQDGFYYDKTKKHDAWTDLAAKMNVSSAAAQQKIKSLLSSFRREKLKGKKTVGTGKGRRDVYVSNWYAFQRMHFLLDRDGPRSTYSSDALRDNDDSNESAASELDDDVTQIPDRSETTEPAETSGQGETDGRGETSEQGENAGLHVTSAMDEVDPLGTTHMSAPTPRMNVSKGRKDLKRRKKRSAADQDAHITEALDILRTVASKRPATEASDASTDECSAFGQYIASKLRGYPERIRSMVQFNINTVLYYTDIGNPEVQVHVPYRPYQVYDQSSSSAGLNISNILPPNTSTYQTSPTEPNSSNTPTPPTYTSI